MFLLLFQSWHGMCNTESRILGRLSVNEHEEFAMQARKTINGLAVAGALIAMIGVSAAATEALAADSDTSETTAIAEEISKNTLIHAEMANVEAVANAAAAMELGARLNLDIELIDRKSLVLVGGL